MDASSPVRSQSLTSVVYSYVGIERSDCFIFLEMI